ncbi:Uncharacterized protein dnm_084660 [Desulfonema magnum]|uniref:Uncharacterized protein n=1 Tax=Desulfonema magnum TaxID=45655 RepID=A0A975BVQ7_9BACT|nr:Uncharacterized protein dnm_084660 [Desulfonema magnum]
MKLQESHRAGDSLQFIHPVNSYMLIKKFLTCTDISKYVNQYFDDKALL